MFNLKKKSKTYQKKGILPLPDGSCAQCHCNVAQKVPIHKSDPSRGRCLECFPYKNGAKITVLMHQYSNGKYSGQMIVQSCPPLIGRREGKGEKKEGFTQQICYLTLWSKVMIYIWWCCLIFEYVWIGIFQYENGDIYKGSFKNDQPCGFGIVDHCNGDRYEGNIRASRPHGKGICKYSDGIVYEGNFIHGKREGKGVLSKDRQIIYDGKWENDQQSDPIYQRDFCWLKICYGILWEKKPIPQHCGFANIVLFLLENFVCIISSTHSLFHSNNIFKGKIRSCTTVSDGVRQKKTPNLIGVIGWRFKILMFGKLRWLKPALSNT